METTYNKGNISESVLLNAYLKAGFFVSIPFGSGAPYDLMVDTGKRALRIQVKTGWYQKGCILFRCVRRVREAASGRLMETIRVGCATRNLRRSTARTFRSSR